MDNKLSIQEGLIKIEPASRFHVKPRAGNNVQVVIMQKSGNSLRHYVTLRSPKDQLTIAEKIWGDFVCFIVDMSLRHTRIDQEINTQDHVTKVRIIVDIAYQAIDAERVVLFVGDAILSLHEEIITLLRREIGKLAIDEIKEEYFDNRIYQEGVRLQNWIGLAIKKVVVSLEYPKEIVEQIRADNERKLKQKEEYENRMYHRELEMRDFQHAAEILRLVETIGERGEGGISMQALLKLVSLPDRKEAFDQIGALYENSARKKQRSSPDAIQRFIVESPTPSSLHLEFPEASALTLKQYSEILDTMRSLEIVYCIYYLLHGSDANKIKSFISNIKGKTRAYNDPEMLSIIQSFDVETFKIISLNYGSPVSFDLLGIAQTMETLHNILKDLICNEARH
jgi:hypothetical protein